MGSKKKFNIDGGETVAEIDAAEPISQVIDPALARRGIESPTIMDSVLSELVATPDVSGRRMAIPDAVAAYMIPLDEIVESSDNTRTIFDEEKMRELKEGMSAKGQLHAVTLMQGLDGRYIVRDGARRVRVARELGWSHIRAEIHPLVSGAEAIILRLIENGQRADITPLEEAEAYLKLTDLGQKVEDISKQIGKSPSHIYAAMKLLALPPEVRTALMKGQITSGHAEKIVRLDDPNDQLRACEVCIIRDLSVRGLSIWIDENVKPKAVDKTIPMFGDETEGAKGGGGEGAKGHGESADKSEEAQVGGNAGAAGVEGVGAAAQSESNAGGGDGDSAQSTLADAKKDLDAAQNEKPREKRAEIGDGPVPDRKMVSGKNATEGLKLEEGIRRRAFQKMAFGTCTSDVISEYVAAQFKVFEMNHFEEATEVAKALRYDNTTALIKAIKGDLFVSTQLLRVLMLVDFAGYVLVTDFNIHAGRPSEFVKMAEAFGVDWDKCEDEEKAAIAGMSKPTETAGSRKDAKGAKKKTEKKEKPAAKKKSKDVVSGKEVMARIKAARGAKTPKAFKAKKKK